MQKQIFFYSLFGYTLSYVLCTILIWMCTPLCIFDYQTHALGVLGSTLGLGGLILYTHIHWHRQYAKNPHVASSPRKQVLYRKYLMVSMDVAVKVSAIGIILLFILRAFCFASYY